MKEVLKAINTAIAFGEGKATRKELDAAYAVNAVVAKKENQQKAADICRKYLKITH